MHIPPHWQTEKKQFRLIPNDFGYLLKSAPTSNGNGSHNKENMDAVNKVLLHRVVWPQTKRLAYQIALSMTEANRRSWLRCSKQLLKDVGFMWLGDKNLSTLAMPKNTWNGKVYASDSDADYSKNRNVSDSESFIFFVPRLEDDAVVFFHSSRSTVAVHHSLASS